MSSKELLMRVSVARVARLSEQEWRFHYGGSSAHLLKGFRVEMQPKDRLTLRGIFLSPSCLSKSLEVVTITVILLKRRSKQRRPCKNISGLNQDKYIKYVFSRNFGILSHKSKNCGGMSRPPMTGCCGTSRGSRLLWQLAVSLRWKEKDSKIDKK